MLKSVFLRYKPKFIFTLTLIFLEAFLGLLFPLFIGFAIDSALNGSHSGAIQLGVLGLAALMVGVGRRVFDSRFYARVFEDVGVKVVSKVESNQSSKKSARLGMLQELVEFLENSFPELINALIGLVGVFVIIASLNFQVFKGSLIVTAGIFVIYWMTSNKTTFFNKSSNDELEKQVDVIAKNDEDELKTHLSRMMKWNIKLSDLEAGNFSATWLVLMAFLMISIIISVNNGVTQYGTLFALVMYVFQYMENVINLPFFYQNWLRLKEIVTRLEMN